ncbi:hypothetical protein HK096_000496, partial [Nowakowskiella sp. JEL0078]
MENAKQEESSGPFSSPAPLRLDTRLVEFARSSETPLTSKTLLNAQTPLTSETLLNSASTADAGKLLHLRSDSTASLSGEAKRSKRGSLYQWAVSDFFSSDAAGNSRALVILNQPICSLTLFKKIWDSVSVRICADGGANRLFDSFESDEERKEFLPDYIHGDLDSVRPAVKDWYESHNVNVSKSFCQDSTDFQKCLKILQELEGDNGTFDVIAYGALGGRLDQSMSSIHLLHCLGHERKLILASVDSFAFLLQP